MRLLVMTGALVAAALVWTGAGFAAEPPQQALDACVAAVEKQIAAGIQAGGGPKSIDVGPANCDTFWFRIGAIGNENSAGGKTP